MKYKITDLMDLYEDKNCPLSPAADQRGRAVTDRPCGEDGTEIKEIKASKHAFGWKEIASLAAVLVLLVLGGFGVKRLLDRGGLQPGQTDLPGQTVATEQIPRDTNDVVELYCEPITGEEQETLSRFLTCFAQQGVESMEDLDEDAELIRFAFIYRRIYDPESIPVQPDADGALWDTLSPEQVNETLSKLLGSRVNPTEGADYSLLRSEPVGGRCSFHDGYFWQEPSGGDHLLRFALATHYLNDSPSIERYVLFTTYEVNLLFWPNAALDTLPALTEEEAEALVREGKLKSLGKSTASLLRFTDSCQLLSYTPLETEPRRALSQEELKAVEPWLSALAEYPVYDLEVDLAGEYELARFAYFYTKLHDPEAIVCESDEDGSYETLTLGQVNAVLYRLLGENLSPAEGAVYAGPEGDETRQAVYCSGRFRWPAADRDTCQCFAVAESGDLVSGGSRLTVHFTVYRPIPDYLAEVGPEALEALSPAEAEALTAEGKLTKQRRGDASLTKAGDGYHLIAYYTVPWDPSMENEDTPEELHTEPSS